MVQIDFQEVDNSSSPKIDFQESTTKSQDRHWYSVSPEGLARGAIKDIPYIGGMVGSFAGPAGTIAGSMAGESISGFLNHQIFGDERNRMDMYANEPINGLIKGLNTEMLGQIGPAVLARFKGGESVPNMSDIEDLMSQDKPDLTETHQKADDLVKSYFNPDKKTIIDPISKSIKQINVQKPSGPLKGEASDYFGKYDPFTKEQIDPESPVRSMANKTYDPFTKTERIADINPNKEITPSEESAYQPLPNEKLDVSPKDEDEGNLFDKGLVKKGIKMAIKHALPWPANKLAGLIPD